MGDYNPVTGKCTCGEEIHPGYPCEEIAKGRKRVNKKTLIRNYLKSRILEEEILDNVNEDMESIGHGIIDIDGSIYWRKSDYYVERMLESYLGDSDLYEYLMDWAWGWDARGLRNYKSISFDEMWEEVTKKS